MVDTTQITPIEDLLCDSDDEEDKTFNSLSTDGFDGSKIPFVSNTINKMVPMNKDVYFIPTHPVVT